MYTYHIIMVQLLYSRLQRIHFYYQYYFVGVPTVILKLGLCSKFFVMICNVSFFMSTNYHYHLCHKQSNSILMIYVICRK